MSSKDLASVRLNLGGSAGSVVEVNGVNYANSVAGVDVQASGWGPPKVSLSLVTHEVVVDGEAKVTVPDETHAALVALGWTPPPAADAARAHELASTLLANPIYRQTADLAETRGLVLGGEVEIEESADFTQDVVRVRFTADLIPADSLKLRAEQAEHLLPESIRQELAEAAVGTGYVTSGRAAAEQALQNPTTATGGAETS
jgi:hypothetical protein